METVLFLRVKFSGSNIDIRDLDAEKFPAVFEPKTAIIANI